MTDHISAKDFRAGIVNQTKTGGKKQYALGRMKPGKMNRTETAYSKHLDILKSLGDVLWWEFEAIKLKLADNTHVTPDFAVMNGAQELEFHDTKGSFAMIEDDAWAKVKIADSKFPFRFFIVAPIDRKFSAWKVEEV